MSVWKGFLWSLSLNLCSLGVLMNKWNNVRVLGRQIAFWEYLWCLAQHCPFLLLTAPIHAQGQYAVLVAAMNQRRWEISLGAPSHTLPLKICWYNDSLRQQNVFKVPHLLLFGRNATAENTATKKKTICFVKVTSDSAPLQLYRPHSLSFESLIGWFKQTVDGWIHIIYVPLIMSRWVLLTDWRWQEAHIPS